MSTKTQIQIAILIIDLVVAGLLVAFGISMTWTIPSIKGISVIASTTGTGWMDGIASFCTAIVNILITVVNVMLVVIQMATFQLDGMPDIINGIFSAMNIALILTFIPW